MFSKSIDNFFFQLYSLLKVDISLIESLRMLSNVTINNTFVSKIATNVLQAIRNGYSFSRSVFLCNGISISTSYRGLLEAGECTGKLTDVLEFICITNKQKEKNIKEIVNAFCYPFFIFFVVLCGTFFLIHWKGSFFTNMTIDEMRGVIYKAIFVFLFLFVLLCFYVYHNLKEPKLFQLYYSLAFLQKSGFTFTRSLELCMGNCSGVKQDLLYDAYRHITTGVSVSESFGMLKLVDKKNVVFLKLGEDSNTVPEVCKQISKSIWENYEVKKITCLRLLEPLSLLIVGFYVAILLHGIFVPYITNFGGIL